MSATDVATVAVVLSGLSFLFSVATLAVTGRRETRKWLREETLQSLYKLFSASFGGQIKPIWDALDSGETDLTAREAKWHSLHTVKQSALTHLRLTASPGVVKAAENLIKYEIVMHNWVSRRPDTKATDAKASYEAGKAKQNEFRRLLFEEARKFLKLPRGATFDAPYEASAVAPSSKADSKLAMEPPYEH